MMDMDPKQSVNFPANVGAGPTEVYDRPSNDDQINPIRSLKTSGVHVEQYSDDPDEESKDESIDLQDIKSRLHEIFNYYASFGDRLNTTNLKS